MTFSARYSSKEIVQYLIENVDININDTGFGITGRFRRNSFLEAAHGGKIETMNYLDFKNPKLKNSEDDYNYYNDYYDDYNYYNDTNIDDTDNDYNYDDYNYYNDINIDDTGFEVTGRFGRNSFMEAAHGGKIETMNYLDFKNPKLKNSKDDHQNTAFNLACAFADSSTIEFLIDKMKMDRSPINDWSFINQMDQCFDIKW